MSRDPGPVRHAQDTAVPATEAKDAYKRGLALYGQKDYAQSIVELRAAIELEPDWPDPRRALGMAQMNAGQLDDALATLLDLTKRAPNDPLAFTSLSMVYVRKEKIEEAEAAQQQARMLTWKEEMKTNPDAPMPEGPGPPSGGFGG